MRYRVCSFVVLSFALLTGCAVDQNKEVNTYRKVIDAGTAAPATQPAPVLTLPEAMRLANRHDERLALRGEDYLQALIAKDRATSAFLPTVSIQPSYGREFGGSGPKDATVVTGVGSINLFNGFQDIENVYRAAATAKQRRRLLLDFQDQVLLDVARTYYAVLRAEQSVVVLRNSISVQEARVSDMRGRENAGIARPLDVAQTEALLASTRVSFLQAQTDVTNGRTTLAFLVNAPVAGAELADQFELPAEHVQLDRVIDAALRRRQDYRAAQSAVEAAKHGVQVAIGEYYPSVSLDLDYFLKHAATDDATWAALLSANVPIFSAGVIEQDVRLAWSVLRQAKLSESLDRRQVEDDVRVAFENYESFRRQVRELEVELAAAQEAFRQAEQSYNVGLATNLERLTAQDQLLSTQLQLTSARFDEKVAFLTLLRTASSLSDAYIEAQTTTQPSTRPTATSVQSVSLLGPTTRLP